MDGKKGISPVIATMILIGAAFVTILILWVSINTLIKTESDKISLESHFVDLKVESVKFDSSGNMFVSVKRNAFGTGEINGVAIIISDGNNNRVIQENEAIMQLEVKTFIIPKESLEGLEAIKTVSIAPILKSDSGKNMQKGIVDEKKLPGNVDFVAGENTGKPLEERKLIVID